MNNAINRKGIALLALTLGVTGGINAIQAMAGDTPTTTNLFEMNEVTSQGQLVAEGHDGHGCKHKDGEHKCGEGKADEHKCGEGDAKADEHKCGEADHDGDDHDAAKTDEHKCGEGSCGSNE